MPRAYFFAVCRRRIIIPATRDELAVDPDAD